MAWLFGTSQEKTLKPRFHRVRRTRCGPPPRPSPTRPERTARPTNHAAKAISAKATAAGGGCAPFLWRLRWRIESHKHWLRMQAHAPHIEHLFLYVVFQGHDVAGC